jgi:hypothetical protein
LLRRKSAMRRSEPRDTAKPTTADAPARSARVLSSDSSPSPSAKSCRHLPAALRRLVWEREGGRCTFMDDRGVRCPATTAIEFHHRQPYARGGQDTAANITLRCSAHNDLAADEDFGRDYMRRRKGWESVIAEPG